MQGKKLLTILFGCLLSLGAAAQPYQSAFGFSTELTENWLIVSREKLAQNPDMLNFDAPQMQGIDPSMARRIKEMVSSGGFELLYYRHNDPDFKDNINVFISNPQRSNLEATVDPLCGNLQKEIRQAYNRSEYTEIYGCERKQLFAVDTISYAFDGAVIGSHSYGFLFNSNGGTVTMTLTCKIKTCPRIFADVEAIFKNMRI